MTFFELINLWDIQNPTVDFWDGINIPESVNKDDLIDYLLYEYGDMEASDTNSGFFRNHVKNFFNIHKWNIEKLAKTLNFSYDPLADSKWHEKHKWEDDKTIKTESNRDITDVTTSEETEVMDDDWTENDKIDNTKTNYVSAYNDALTNDKRVEDTEHHRDTEHGTIDKVGTDDRNTITDETTNQITDDDLKKNEVTDDDILENTWHHGNNNHTFQSLIKEEREQAQFNIYKWIGKHFSSELLICVW